MRFLDFLSMNMIIPTLPQYVSNLGGNDYVYYAALGCQAVCSMIGTTILGSIIDRGPGRMLPAYLATSAMMVLGNAIFVSAGTVAALRSPWTLVVARGIVGLGGSNNVLISVFVVEVCTAEERQKWLIRIGIVRSQGLFWGPPVGVALAAIAAPGPASLFGYEVLPGWFQLLSSAAAAAVLWWTWAAPQEHAAPAELAGESLPQGLPFGAFLRQRRVRVLFLVIGFFGMCIVSCENIIPVVTRNALGWAGAACGWPLTTQAILLTCGQMAVMKMTGAGVQDCKICSLGTFGVSLTCAGAVLLWGLLDVHGGGKPQTLVALGPFLFVALFGPSVLLGNFTTFARLSLEDIPRHKAKLQALQNNVCGVCLAMSPAWLSATYAGDRAKREGVPSTCMASFATVGILVALLMLSQLSALKPSGRASHHAQQKAPLLENKDDQ